MWLAVHIVQGRTRQGSRTVIEPGQRKEKNDKEIEKMWKEWKGIKGRIKRQEIKIGNTIATNISVK